MQAPLDRGRGKGEETGDLPDRPLFEVVELQHDPVVRGKRLQDPAYAGRLVPALQGVGGMDSQLGALAQDEPVQLRAFHGLGPPLLPADAPRPVAGDGADPGSEPRRIFELWQRLERQQERFLRDVLRRRPRSQHPLGDRHHRSPVAPHQLVERCHVAEQRAENQLLVADIGEAPIRAPVWAAAAGRQFLSPVD